MKLPLRASIIGLLSLAACGRLLADPVQVNFHNGDVGDGFEYGDTPSEWGGQIGDGTPEIGLNQGAQLTDNYLLQFPGATGAMSAFGSSSNTFLTSSPSAAEYTLSYVEDASLNANLTGSQPWEMSGLLDEDEIDFTVNQPTWFHFSWDGSTSAWMQFIEDGVGFLEPTVNTDAVGSSSYLAGPGSYEFITYLGGAQPIYLNGPGSVSYSIANSFSASVQFDAVPEPTPIFAFGAGFAALAIRRRAR